MAALVWIDAGRVLRALLGAVALSVEALEAPDQPFDAWVRERKGHPGQLGVAAYLREALAGSTWVAESSRQSCYSLRCAPQGLCLGTVPGPPSTRSKAIPHNVLVLFPIFICNLSVDTTGISALLSFCEPF